MQNMRKGPDKKKNETIELQILAQDKIQPQHVHVKPMHSLQ